MSMRSRRLLSLDGGADGSSESDTLRLILSRLLRSGRRAAFADEDEDEEDEHWSRLPRNRDFQYSPRSEPHPDGIALQRSGDFGAVPKALMTKQPVQRTVSNRKRSLVPLLRDELSQDVVPNSAGTVVARYGSNVYAGQFSTDASFYYTCVQDFRLHIYNTKAPTLQNPHVDGTSPKPAGVLIGHTEGITYVAPKGDGRYIISNGKDQTLKLWDLRKMAPFSKFWEVRGEEYGIPDFDYRRETYPKPIREDHPHDCSVMSYRGHRVLRTLIRCNFSPAETTGSRYLYSGSSDGMIHIWALDGTLVQKIDRKKVHDIGIDPSETEGPIPNPSTRRTAGYPLVVRDVAWHPQEPVLMSCSWAGPARRNSEVAKHEWKGLNKLGGRLEDFVEREQQETKERQARIPAPPSHGGWY
ncbi:hypothetical protein FRC14_004476 [Serendipita sp. 396]|nr:hypothetical protein FRC14_004476 [Serendipita sp. 396]